MKKAFISILLFFSMLFVSAQGGFVGYLYSLKTGTKEAFGYSVSTKFDNGAFQTIYKLSKPGTDKVRYTITSSHFKLDKKVIVEVDDEQYLLSSVNGKEEVKYEAATLQPFGIRGNVGVLDKSAPNQLAVQFLNSRFEYVRVISFLGAYSNGIFQFFLFNESDKIAEQEEKIANGFNKIPKAKFSRTNEKDSTISQLFEGKKKFCDETNNWFYEVTIKEGSISISSFHGKGNSNKNKDVAITTIKGIVKNDRIIIKGAVDEFKYMNGKFYELNNEGEYNEYTECQ